MATKGGLFCTSVNAVDAGRGRCMVLLGHTGCNCNKERQVVHICHAYMCCILSSPLGSIYVHDIVINSCMHANLSRDNAMSAS